MPISDDDYNRYLKPCLDNEALWRDEDAFYHFVIDELLPRVSEDNRMDDYSLILRELATKRRQLLDENPIKGYTIDVDDEGNFVGEFKTVGVQWFL